MKISFILKKLICALSFLFSIKQSSSKAERYHRTNFCPLHKQVESNEISRQNALFGRNITVAIPLEGDIDPSNPYISVRILDELSRRAKFNYITYISGDIIGNETYTELLYRTTQNYDLVVDSWDRTSERLGMGIIFPEIWFNSDTIMIAKIDRQEENAFVFWAFSRPFSPGLWLLTLSMMVVTGVTYHFLDFLSVHADRKNLFSSMEGCIFISFYSFTGSRSVFAPKSRSCRILTLSMAFLYLILVSAYTANLTNFYVAKGAPSIPIRDIDDAVEKNLLICVVRGYESTQNFKQRFPHARTLELQTEADVVVGVSEELCDVGLITIESYETYKYALSFLMTKGLHLNYFPRLLFRRDTNFNKDCNIEWIGRRIFMGGAGFALGDSLTLCSSILDNVLDYHLLQMKREGKIDELTNIYRDKTASNTCVIRLKGEQTKNSSLQVLNLGGAFVFHLCLIFISVIAALYDYFCQPESKRKELMKYSKGSLQSSETMSCKNASSQPLAVEIENFQPASGTDEESNQQINNLSAQKLGQGMPSASEIIERIMNEQKELFLHLERQRNLEESLRFEALDIKSRLTREKWVDES